MKAPKRPLATAYWADGAHNGAERETDETAAQRPLQIELPQLLIRLPPFHLFNGAHAAVRAPQVKVLQPGFHAWEKPAAKLLYSVCSRCVTVGFMFELRHKA